MDLLTLDHRLTFSLFHWGSSNPALQRFFLIVASVFIYLLPIILIWLFFRSHGDRLRSVKIFLVAVLSWQVLAQLLGSWLYTAYDFRERPFAAIGLQELFFEQPEKAFPSDHAAVMFGVMAAFFGYKYPRLGWLFLIGGLISSFGRVAVGFHYVGDILGGVAIGVIAYGLIRLLDTTLDKALEPILRRLPLKQ